MPDPDAGEGELRAYVTGIGGIVSDSIEVFESIDTTLLLVTVGLVLVLLLAIYRSPVVALVPLFVVAIAYGIAAAAVYGLVEAGALEVNGQTTSLLIVLMFGAGTDYCLLIVSRYREELRRFEDKHEAMAHATERTGPGDPLGRRDRDRRDARPDARRLPRHPDDGPGAGARRRGDAARRPHPPAGAAGGARPQLLLAVDPAPRQRAAGAARDLAPGRPLRPRALERSRS